MFTIGKYAKGRVKQPTYGKKILYVSKLIDKNSVKNMVERCVPSDCTYLRSGMQ